MITNMRIIKDLVKRLYKKSGNKYTLDFKNNCVRYKMKGLYITSLEMFNLNYIDEYSYFNIVENGYEKIINKDTSKYAILEPEAIRIINGTKCLSLYNIDTNCYTDIEIEYIEKISKFKFDNTMVFKQTYNSKDLVYIYRKEDNELLAIISPYIRK